MDMLERSPRFKLAGSLALCGLLIVSPLLAVFRSIRASEAAVMTGQCHVLSSLSSAVLAFLAYLFFTWLVREHVLPACCAPYRWREVVGPPGLRRAAQKMLSSDDEVQTW